MPSNSAGVAVVTWFHHRLEEEYAQKIEFQKIIPGFSVHLTESDDLISITEGPVAQAEGPDMSPTGLSMRDS